MNDRTQLLLEAFVSWQLERQLSNGSSFNIKYRINHVRSAVNKICNLLKIEPINFYTATVEELEKWFPTIEAKTIHHKGKQEPAYYTFRHMLEMKGSTLSPISKRKWKIKPRSSYSPRPFSLNQGFTEFDTKLHIIVSDHSKTEVIVSSTKDGLLQFKITQLEG